MEIKITDNSGLAKDEMEAAVLRALEKCGLVAEGYAKKLCPVDTGNLRNSITHRVEPEESVVYIGTNSEYAPYVELGTGKYYPGGRQLPDYSLFFFSQNFATYPFSTCIFIAFTDFPLYPNNLII